MKYEIIRFEFSPVKRSYATVLHTPDWFGRNLLRRKSVIIDYEGVRNLWFEKGSFKPVNKKLCQLLHEKFREEEVKCKAPRFAKSLGALLMFLGDLFKRA